MFGRSRSKRGASRGRPAHGAILSATGPIKDDKGIGRVVFSLDDRARLSPVVLSRIQARLRDVLHGADDTSEARYVRELLATPTAFDLAWRHRLPSSLTQGVPCLVTEVLLEFNHLPAPFLIDDLNHGLLPGMAEEGDGAEFEILPYDLEGVRSRRAERIEAVGARGRKVPVVLVQANNELYAPGGRDLPGLVAWTFQKDLPDRTRLLIEIASRLGELKDRPARTDAERQAAEMLEANESGWRYHRRWTLPTELTEGATVHLADLWIVRDFLRSGYLTKADIALPCVAEPGEEGGIEQLSHEVAKRSSENRNQSVA